MEFRKELNFKNNLKFIFINHSLNNVVEVIIIYGNLLFSSITLIMNLYPNL
jgi:hypothetical protein